MSHISFRSSLIKQGGIRDLSSFLSFDRGTGINSQTSQDCSDGHTLYACNKIELVENHKGY
jgi:hypothetical protein